MEYNYDNYYDRQRGEPIRLWKEGETPLFDEAIGQREPMLHSYLLKDKPNAGVVIVCAGGGYTHRAYHEGEPVAEKLNELGLHTLVLSYRVAPYKHPAMLHDAQRAIRTVKFFGKSWGVNAEKVAVLGFSAGGHLSAMAATLFDNGDESAVDLVERMSSRPDAAVICYGVTSMVTRPHRGSLAALLGEAPNAKLLASLSPELNVTDETPPCFLWHTAQDMTVDPLNSLDMAQALIKRGITCALHVYPYGSHGIGLGAAREGMYPENNQAVHWPDEAARFLKEEGF